MQEIDEQNQTVSEILSLLSKSSNNERKNEPPQGFIDKETTKDVTKPTAVLYVIPKGVKVNGFEKLIDKSQIY